MGRKRERGNEQALEVVKPAKWTAAEKKALKKLEEFSFEATRFADRDLLFNMGLVHAFDKILKKMGLECLAKMDHATYIIPTMHFLATMEYYHEANEFASSRNGWLTFKIKDKAYKLSMYEVAQAYDFDVNADEVEFRDLKCANEFWDLLANGNYVSNRSTILQVRNPVLRYILKLLACTISGREVSTSVTKLELSLLFQGIKGILEDDDGEPWKDCLGSRASYSCIVSSTLRRYKMWCSRTSKKRCSIGGWLTPLFIQAGVNIEEFEAVEEKAYLDTHYLMHMHTLGKSPGKQLYSYYFYDETNKRKVCILPNLKETTPRCMGTIEFLPTDEECNAAFIASMELEKNQHQPWQPTIPKSSTSFDDLQQGYKLPRINFQPKTKTEKFLATVVEMQRKINKWQAKVIGKLVKKVKKIQPPNYVSSESEDEGLPGSDEEEELMEEEMAPPRYSEGGVVIREPMEVEPRRLSLQTDPSQARDKGKGKVDDAAMRTYKRREA